MNILGLIPARSGSQELKNKNLLKINGKTLLEIALQEAKKASILIKYFYQQIVKVIKQYLKIKN